MSATEERTAYVGAPVKRREDRVAAHGPGHVRRQHDARRDARDGRRAEPVRAAPASRASPPTRRARPRASSPSFTAADLQDDWKAAMPCAWPVTEDMKNPPHYPAHRDAALPGRRRRGRARRDARAGKGRGRARRGRLRRRSTRSSTSRRRSRTARTLVHPDLGTNECYVWRLDTDATGQAIDDADVVVTRRYVQPRLIPNAIEPRAALAVPGQLGDVTLYSATQVPHLLRVLAAATLGMHETKLRVVAPDVGGGFGSKLDVYAEELLAVALATPARPAGEVGRGALGELPRDDPRPRRRHGVHARRDEGRDDHALPGEGHRRDGRVPAARHAGRPAARRLDLLRARTRSRTTASSSPASSRTRRRPTRTAAPAARRPPT